MENSNAGKAILGLGLGFGALGIAYYLYKNNQSSNTTSEEEATVTYGGFSGGEYAGISEGSGGAVTTSNDNNTTSSLQDIISGVLTPLLTASQQTKEIETVGDLWGTINGENTTKSGNSNSDYNYGGDEMNAYNANNPSDEKADTAQVNTGNNAGTVNTTPTVNTTKITESDYLNTYGLTSTQYDEGLTEWMSNYGGLTNKDTVPDNSISGKTYEEMYQSYLATNKYYFENSKYYDVNGNNRMITDENLEAQLKENAEKYRTEGYDTAQQDATMIADTNNGNVSVEYLQKQASQQNKYSYSGEAATGTFSLDTVATATGGMGTVAYAAYLKSKNTTSSTASNTKKVTGASGTTYTYDTTTQTKSDGSKLTVDDAKDIALGLMGNNK